MSQTGHSLTLRIVAWLALWTAVTAGLLMAVLAFQFRSSAVVLRDQGLYDLTRRIAESLLDAPDGGLRLDLPADIAANLDPAGELYFSVSEEAKRVLFAGGEGTHPLHPFEPHSGGKVEYFQHVNPDGQGTYYGATVQWQVVGRPLWIQVSREVQHGDTLIDLMAATFLGGAGWVILPFLAGLLVINLISVRRSLGPLQAASAQAAAIGPGRSDLRLPEHGLPREVLPLVRAVNHAFDRLDRALEEQRNFTADAAHELLTPLSVIRAHLDTLEDQGLAHALRADVEPMAAIVAQLLELAELDALTSSEGGLVDVREVCVEVAAALAPHAYRQGKQLAVTGTETPVGVRCCRKDLTRAVGNLVSNAIAHTPKGTAVEIELQADGALRVIDRGPGVPADARDLVFQRFWRGPDRNSVGAGLGLSIVKRFAETCGARIDVDDAPGGGAVFTLRLPTIAAP